LTAPIELLLFRHLIFFFLFVIIGFRFELAEECADDDEAKLATSELRKGVLEELKMQNSFVQV
jgi:hypothetical protein